MLRVWLPPRYDAPENSSRLYPVLYLNDGQNLFDRTIAFGGVEWQVDETADRLIRQEVIAPLIIVGIDNAQGERIKNICHSAPLILQFCGRWANVILTS